MSTSSQPKRVGVFGWGLVAPGARNVDEFSDRLQRPESWLQRFGDFGPSNFLVGEPAFDFQEYEPWISKRFPPNRFGALDKKMGTPTKYAIGAFIQSLRQNPGIEEELIALGDKAQVILGAGLADLLIYHQASEGLCRAQRRWDRFWADPANNRVFQHFRETGEKPDGRCPKDPATVEVMFREEAEDVWWGYWAAHSPQLGEYLDELREIEAMTFQGEVESGKAAVIKAKHRAQTQLAKKWKTPDPPWAQVSPNALWNIPSNPAAQVSMMGRITGMVYAPYAACATFGCTLKLGMDAIKTGQAKAVVIGSADPAPNRISVGTFYSARVLSADGRPSKPLSGMKGTHVSGGSVVWIIGDLDYFEAKGMKPLGMEPVSVSLNADADHIITPSVPGPQSLITRTLEAAGIEPHQVGNWDMHATGTPGDFLEVHTASTRLPPETVLVARKGTFGHGMGTGGGWELMAQYLGYARGELFPTTLTREELNPEIAKEHQNFVFDEAVPARGKYAGKLSMGVGGINACIISRVYD